jgi:apxIVA var3
MSRELVAKAELDRVEKMLEEAGIIRNGEVNLAKLFINDTSESLNTLAKDKLEKLKHGKSGLFLVTQAGNIAVDLANGEAGVKTALNLAVDTILFVAQVTPVGMAIYRANLVASHFGYNIGSLAGEIYDWATKGDKYKDYITQDGFLRVVMDDGTVYMRPLKGRYGLATGNYMNDVLFGGDWNDTLQGGNGSDLLIGGDGFDTYNAGILDIIRDSDGKGEVYFKGYKLTGGTYDKDRDLYISDDYIKYKLHNDGRLEVSYIGDNITIENFNKDNNDLGIILIDPKDIVVTIHDNQANEGGNGKHTLGFKVSLNRKLEAGEYLTLYINGQRIKFKEGDIEQTYTHTWDGNTIKEEDRKFEVSASVVTDKSIVKAKLAQAGNETIIDDYREFTNLNLLVA